MRRFRILVAIATLAGLALPASAAEEDVVAHGRALVENNCIRCHALQTGEPSTHPEAPALASLSERYPLDALEEAFAEGIVTGHPDMPEFEATPEQIEAILAYLASIQGED